MTGPLLFSGLWTGGLIFLCLSDFAQSQTTAGEKSNNQNLQADVPLSVKLKNFVQKLNDILRRLL